MRGKLVTTLGALVVVLASFALTACDDSSSGTDAGPPGTDAGPSFDPTLVSDCDDLCASIVGTTCSSGCGGTTCEASAIMARAGDCEPEYGAFLDCALDAVDVCDALQGTAGSCATEWSAYFALCP